MAIVVVYLNHETSEGVFDPEEHFKIAKACPVPKLPGVIEVAVRRHATGKRIFSGQVKLESWADLQTLENWHKSDGAKEWHEKFAKTGKFFERIIMEVYE